MGDKHPDLSPWPLWGTDSVCKERQVARVKDNLVTQSNRLIEASHTLTLNEKRLVLIAASLIDPRKPPPDGFLLVHADAFADVFGLDINHTYEALEDAANRLYERDLRRYEKGELVERMRWVFHVKYRKGMGYVELGFSPTIIPHLTLLKREFTSYQLRQIGNLNSFYAVRLYELMSQFHKLGTRECSLEQLRQMLDLGDKYPNVKDLRKRVIDPALREVNESTDLTVALAPRLQGRKIIGFQFTITKDDQLPLPLD